MKLKNKIISLITSLVILLSFSQNGIIVLAETYNTLNSIEYGDIFDDNKINVTDSIYLTSYLIDNTKQINSSVSDLNGDNNINIQDLILLKKYLLNVITLFPIQIKELQESVDEINASRDTEIQMTAEMLLKTQELNTPEAVYEYVKNNIRNEFYYGSKKGAVGTFEELSGNNIDQASLLIAMLSYLGYEANYSTGYIKLTPEQAINWTCTDNLSTILNLFVYQTNGDVKVDDLNAVSCIMPLHTWVQVKINGKVYNLDPSFKQYTIENNSISNNFNIPNVDIDELIECNDEYSFNSAINEYQQTLSKYQNAPVYVNNNKINKISVTKLPEKLECELLDENITTFTSIKKEKSSLSNKVTFSLGTDSYGDLNSKSITTAELYNKNIIIRYDSSSVPKLYINNNEVLTYKTLGMQGVYGTPELIVNINLITGTDNQSITLEPGAVYSITFDYGNISSIALQNAYDNVLSISDSVDSSNVLKNEYLGEFLHLAGVMYFAQLDIQNYLLSQQYNVYSDNQLSMCITSYSDKTLCIDVPVTWNNVFNLSVPEDDSDTAVRDYRMASGMVSTKLEDTIWHELTGYEGASTINVLEEANRNNIDILMISSANESTELSKLNYTNSIYSEIKNIIKSETASGRIVIIPVTEINIGVWNGTGYISVDPVSGFTTDKVISRINGFNLNGGFSTCTVDITFLINSIFSISGIYGSIQVMYYGLAIFTFCPVAGGIIFVGGTIGLISSMYSYCENIETMYRYMKGDESAGTDLVYTAGVNIVSGILSYGLNAAINKFAIPAIKNQLIKRYTDDFVESLVPDAIIYPDGTIESLYNCGEYAPDISDIMVNNPGFDIVVTEYTEDITNLMTQQGFELVNQIAGLLTYDPEIAIPTVTEHGQDGAYALVINQNNYKDAYVNDNIQKIYQMIEEAKEISSFIDENFELKPQGSQYTDSIFTIPEKYLNEQHIEKFARATAYKLSEMIRNKDIVKTNTKGRIASQVLSVAINNQTGKVYYGLSNPSNNPTYNSKTNPILKKLIDNAGEPPISYRGNGFYNCGEYNAINNALTSGSNIENLYVYSIRIFDDVYYPPCRNCKLLYSTICRKIFNSEVNFIE